MKISYLFFFIIILIQSSQLLANSNVELQLIEYKDISNWNKGKQINTYKALLNSCQKIIKSNQYTEIWKKSCQNIIQKKIYTDKDARKIIEDNFLPYKIYSQKKIEGFFTGYYEPCVYGSLSKNNFFKTPVYKTPKDLIQKKTEKGIKYGRISDGTLVPYYTREEIKNNNIIAKENIIVWIKSDIELSFLQIQGSGKINLNNGKVISLGYDSQNGHPYKSIGRYLIEKKILSSEKINMKVIKKWLYEHPKERDMILNYDPSFVFFRVLSVNESIVGAQGVSLTPGYSIAIDNKFYKYGTPIWIDINYKCNKKNYKINRLMIAQDSGGDIKGYNRGDIFWGNGKNAENCAGNMKHKGKILVLLPK